MHKKRLIAESAAIFVAILGFLIWHQLYYHAAPKDKTPSPIETFSYTDPAFKYQVTVPKSWRVQSDMAVPNGAVSHAALAPSSVLSSFQQKYQNDTLVFVTIDEYKSNQDPKSWFKSQQLSTTQTVLDQNMNIKGNPIYYAKSVNPLGMTDNYIISHNGVLLDFAFRQTINKISPSATLDYSSYTGAYDHIFTSLKFM